jgi:predicted DCC family thiol-disulfide oxidoreductase YuxK
VDSETNIDPLNFEILLYDGSCGLCSRTVRFVLEHERSRSLRFARLQGSIADEIFERHPNARDIDSVVLFEPSSEKKGEKVRIRSDAALRVAAVHLAGAWRLLALGYLVPRPIRDAVYDFIARHRHRIAGNAACFTPTDSDSRSRFLD